MTESSLHPIRWTEIAVPTPDVIDGLEAGLGLPRTVCQLIARRGYTDPEAARAYMRPSLGALHDPFLMKGLSETVDRLMRAIAEKEPIGIHGDYDVDGLTSTTLLTKVLRDLGATVTPFVPHRMTDGYGVSLRAMNQFHKDGIRLVLTCDTGSSAAAEIRTARKKLGMEVLVTDHHTVGSTAPGADIFINPHQDGDEYPFKDLCGVGVAYKVLQGLVRRLGLSEAEVLHPYLDLVALGTVADVVPLKGENRVFVRYGIAACKQTQNIGIRALLTQAKKLPEEIDEWTFGFALGPRLNAAGRIDDAAVGLRLLLAETPEEAKRLAIEIEELNNRRKAMTAAIEQSAVRQVEAMGDLDDNYAIALFGDDRTGEDATQWHHGVIGIVASRIVERYGRPTFLFAKDGMTGKFKGSGRAPKAGDIDLYKALDKCRSHLLKFGGHQAAAGATLKGHTREELQQFANAFNAAAQTMMAPEDRIPQIKTDMEVSVEDLNAQTYGFIQQLAPFGQGNEPIRLVMRDVEVLEIRSDKKSASHLFLKIRKDGVETEAVAWRMCGRYPDAPRYPVPFRADLVFGIEMHEWKGQQQVRLILDDIHLPQVRAVDLGAVPAEAGQARRPEVRFGDRQTHPDLLVTPGRTSVPVEAPPPRASGGFGGGQARYGGSPAPSSRLSMADYDLMFKEATEGIVEAIAAGTRTDAGAVQDLGDAVGGRLSDLRARAAAATTSAAVAGLPLDVLDPAIARELQQVRAAHARAVAYMQENLSAMVGKAKRKLAARKRKATSR